MTRRALFPAFLCVAAGLTARPARADRDRDHDRARRAFERGEVLPLSEILARLRSELGGEVVGVSFERKRDRWIYELKVIGPAGRLAEIHVDAATAHIIEREEH